MRDFTETVRNYAINPRHAGTLADANAVGEAGAITQGHVLRLMLRINPVNEGIEAARFLTFGGSATIAVAEALCRLVTGKTLAEAGQLTGADIAAALAGVPQEEMQGTALGVQALAAAMAAFRGEAPPRRNGSNTAETAPMQITPPAPPLPRRAPPAAQALARRAQDGATTARPPLPMPLSQIAQPDPAPPLSAEDEARQQAEIAAIVADMRPVFQRDGGDITLGSVQGLQVFVRLSGACAGCMMASHTLGALRARLVAALGRPFRVIPLGQGQGTP